MLKQFWRVVRQHFNGWRKAAAFAGRFRPLCRRAILANVFGGLSSALQLVVPLATVIIINEALPAKDSRLLFKISALMGLATIGAILTAYFEFYHAAIFRERVALMLETELFEHVQSQPYMFFKNNESGYVMSRILNDSSAAVEVVMSMTGIGRSVIWVLSGAILLPVFNVKLGLLIVTLIPAYFVLLLWFNQRTKEAFAIVQEKTAVASRELFESLSGVYETKACGAQKHRARRYASALVEKARILIKGRMLMTAGGQVSQIFSLIVSFCVIIYGGAAVIAGQLSLGALIGLNALAAYLLFPISRMVQESLKVQQSLASIERIDELRSLEPESLGRSANGQPAAHGRIRYERVSFAYENRSPILSEVSFEIMPGEVVLLAGPSGVGKTTLVSLLMRFLEPTSGDIRLDGVSIKKTPPAYLRRQIALVSQDAFLFSDSIRNNIRMANLKAADSDIISAARLANALEMIERLPQGFNTEVGERGARLSGGQRQRIAIARALVRNAPILIMDEATSAVDPETEAAVHDALCHLLKDRTTIIISHHASAFIEHVDRIFTLEDGCLSVRPRYPDTPSPSLGFETAAKKSSLEDAY